MLKRGRIITRNLYRKQVTYLSIDSKIPGICAQAWSHNTSIWQCSAKCCKARLKLFEKKKINISWNGLPQPPYSLNNALFRSIKKSLENALLPNRVFEIGFKHVVEMLPERWGKVISNDYQYHCSFNSQQTLNVCQQKIPHLLVIHPIISKFKTRF